MINVNSFRFGEISRKQAGRFLEDGYNNGSFTFRNALSMYDGGMKRRPPISTIIDLDKDVSWYVIHAVNFSDIVSDSFLVAIGSSGEGSSFANIVSVYRRNASGNFEHYSDIRTTESSGRMFCIGNSHSNQEICMSRNIAEKISFAQHGRRLYMASHDFMTMYIDFTSTVQAVIPNFIYNQDSKNKIWYIPGRNESEGRVLFESNGKYYTDIECTEEYTDTEGLSKKRKADNTFSSGYDDFNAENKLNNGPNTYPSIINFISERMWLANTRLSPNAIWCSRSLGSSQWIADYSSDSMHDFTEFQVVVTNGKDLIDPSEWPVKDSDYYHTENGLDRWFIPEYDIDFENAVELKRESKYWKYTSGGKLFYKSDGEQYTWTSSSGKPRQKEDGTFVADTSSGEISLDYYIASEVYPLSVAESEGNKGYWHASDYTWIKPDGSEYDISEGYPVKWPYTEYDMSNPDLLYEDKSDVSYITTDSCALCHIEINGGKDSEIEFIESSLGRIIIGTSSSEHLLPSDFSPVSNYSQEEYSSYGCIGIKPVKLGSSFVFAQKGRILKELYKSSGYILTADAIMYNHDIISSDMVCMESMQSPYSMVYVVLSDGTMVALHYSRDDALSSPSVWSTDGVGYRWITVSHNVQKDDLLMLCYDGSFHICMFDEDSNIYEDNIGNNKYGYDTLIETVFAEINNNNIVFGKFKKAKAIHIRPYETGHIYIGNDLRMLQKSNLELGSYDYSFQAFGKSSKNFSMFIKSCGNEPMNILALSWENE